MELQPAAFEGATARAHNGEHTRYNDILCVALCRPTLRALTGPPTWNSPRVILCTPNPNTHGDTHLRGLDRSRTGGFLMLASGAGAFTAVLVGGRLGVSQCACPTKFHRN